MTKSEIIELALKQMDNEEHPPSDGSADYVSHESYDDIVIAELNEQLPAGDIKTCEDLKHLSAECCGICHTFYPHYDMSLETLPDATKAWICCSLRSALRKSDPKVNESQEFIDLELVLGGRWPKVDVGAEDETESHVKDDCSEDEP